MFGLAKDQWRTTSREDLCQQHRHITAGATPAEAVSWGKVAPDTLPDCVVCYADSTIALPLLTAYCLSRVNPRRQKRLYHRRDEMLDRVKAEYLRTGTVTKVKTSRKIAKRVGASSK